MVEGHGSRPVRRRLSRQPNPSPLGASYVDEKSVRDEFTRVAEVCSGCRRCTDLCGVFPDLFDLLERVREPGKLTPAEQDAIADECFDCGRCAVGCPYAPPVHELAVDVPRLLLRHRAMLRATGQVPIRSRLGTWMLATGGVVARLTRSAPGSWSRRLVGCVTDIDPNRLIPRRVRVPFSAEHRRRRSTVGARPDRASVALFTTCVVEHETPSVGHALVDVYERNGIECAVSQAGCCGAPQLYAGDLDGFRKVATRTIDALASEIGRHGVVVVPRARCLHVVTQAYPEHVDAPEARLVADHTVGAVDHLVDRVIGRHRSADGPPATGGDVPSTLRIGLHRSDPVSPVDSSAAHRELLEPVVGTVVTVDRSAGVGVAWGWRKRHADRSRAIARVLADEFSTVVADVVVTDDHHAATALEEETGARPLHPLELLARVADPQEP